MERLPSVSEPEEERLLLFRETNGNCTTFPTEQFVFASCTAPGLLALQKMGYSSSSSVMLHVFLQFVKVDLLLWGKFFVVVCRVGWQSSAIFSDSYSDRIIVTAVFRKHV